MSTADLITRLRAMTVHVDDAAYVSARPVADLMREAADALEAATKRTAEDERRDVLLKLDALAAEKGHCGFLGKGTVADHRREAAAVALRMAYEVIERGDHEGAAGR